MDTHCSFRLDLVVAFFISCCWFANVSGNVTSTDVFYYTRIVELYGTNGSLSADELTSFIRAPSSAEFHTGAGSREMDGQSRPSVDECARNDWTRNVLCLQHKCMDGEDILALHSMDVNGEVNVTQLSQLSPTLLYAISQQADCTESGLVIVGPKPGEVWGYSFLCVTVINLCSLMGMVFLPLMQRAFYQKLLMFMVALAVGTLVGSSLLFLIPEAFDMASEHNPNYESYVWKCSTVIGGIYLFFLVERILKHIMDLRNKKETAERPVDPDVADLYEQGGVDNQGDNSHVIQTSIPTHSSKREETINMSFDVPTQIHHLMDTRTCDSHVMTPNVSAYSMQTQLTQVSINQQKEENEDFQVAFEIGDSAMTSNTTSNTNSISATSAPIRSVAWMVIFGDGLHNFIDGLSIGAAFSRSIMAGVSISVAVVCEELPHELGDFAILLNSGMSMRQALGYNFLSACMCYLGLLFGILVGETTHGSTWIFALAGGMFLYISLVDMLPEVNLAAEKEGKDWRSLVRIFLIQNSGLLLGYGVMVTLALFSEHINFET